ncbi:MAG: PAS domain-containing sensor histidine kinase, partial [Planctomycetaceae bacterium]
RAIVEDQTEMICRFLSDGTLTFVNQACCNCFGVKREDIIGRKILSLISHKYRRRIKSAIASPDPGKPVETIEHQVVVKGQTRWHQWTHRAIFDDGGNFVEYQSAGRDITDRKTAEETLQTLHIQLMNAQEVERRRLAGDLHDSLGQQMIAMNYNIRDIVNRIPTASDHLKRLSDDCQRIVREIREISHGLYPATLESLGLATSLRQLAAECKSCAKIIVRTSPKKFQRRYGTTVEIALFRIAQEALHNCLRHSNANEVLVSLTHKNRNLLLSVQDDGCGFDISKTTTGFGLNTMKERARAVGGKLQIVSGNGKTQITVDVPLTPDNQANKHE